MKVTSKFQFKQDLRRLTFTERPSLSTLQTTLHSLFSPELPSTFTLKYIDEENDKITVSHDSELAEAWSYASKKQPAIIRFIIEAAAAPQPAKIKIEEKIPKEQPNKPEQEEKKPLKGFDGAVAIEEEQ